MALINVLFKRLANLLEEKHQSAAVCGMQVLCMLGDCHANPHDKPGRHLPAGLYLRETQCSFAAHAA